MAGRKKNLIVRKPVPSDKPKDYGKLVGYKWTDEVRAYIVEQLGAYRAKLAIYNEITDKNFFLKHGFEGLNPEYQDYEHFKRACLKIKKTEIEKAHKAWLVNWRGVPYASSKARVEGLNEMIDLLKEIKEDRTKYSEHDADVTITGIVNSIRKLIRDIRLEMDAEAEREAKAASGTNIYIGRSLIGNEVTPELLNDSFIALYAEYGPKILGLENWSMDKLTALATEVNRVISSKQKTIEADFQIVEGENEGQDNNL